MTYEEKLTKMRNELCHLATGAVESDEIPLAQAALTAVEVIDVVRGKLHHAGWDESPWVPPP